MSRVILAILVLSLTGLSQTIDPALAGNQLFSEGKYAEALAAFEQVPAAARTSAVLNRMGISYHLLNRAREAEAAYKQAIKVGPDEAAAYNNLGALYYYQRKFGNADGQFRRAAENDPQSIIVRRNLRSSRYARENGRVARTRGDEIGKVKPLLVDQPNSDYLAILMLMPVKDAETATNFEKRGDAFLARKMYEDAIVEYRKSISTDKYNAAVVNRLGLAYHQTQKYEDAERQYREALKLNPFYLDALNNLGTIFYSRKRFSSALDNYRKALKIWPDSSSVLQNLGAVLFEMERHDEAIVAYKRALELDPKLFERLSAGGVATLIQTNQPTSMMTNFSMAKLFAGLGDKDRAISSLYKAYDSGFRDVGKIKAEPAFTTLAGEERFLRLIETMSLPGGPQS